jgi:5-oxoprolinase (ATP-hydrolysing)
MRKSSIYSMRIKSATARPLVSFRDSARPPSLEESSNFVKSSPSRPLVSFRDSARPPSLEESSNSAKSSSPEKPGVSYRIGIDIGGTFTDFVIYQPATGELHTFKLLSTPDNPARAVLEGLRRYSLLDPDQGKLNIIHGSTVATNALLERKGARTALVSTRGFRDVLQIGRQNRPSLYDLFADPPQTLVPAELRFEVDERVDCEGQVLKVLDPDELAQVVADLEASGAESVAVSLLFSFLHPAHEARLGQALREAGFFASLSSEILPEYREYERTSTTAVNAYVSPILEGYLGDLEQELGGEAGQGKRLRVMQSNGGHISLTEAQQNGVRCILSGPAGGVVGAINVGRLALVSTEPPLNSQEVGKVKLITFDMGGTSTDVSLVDGQAQVTTDSVVSGCPIRIPVLDIHTIGAGGGSLATVDLGGALRVGPQSAGADPGPACYGIGELPTVTDANLVLGRLAPENFLGGQMPLHPDRAWQALSRLGQQLGLDPVAAALGVIEVVNTHMERALRVISIERGYDPREFCLLSFGGAGGLHAADLARQLDIPQVLVPPLASTLSAFGMLAADVVKDYTQTVMLPGDTPLPEITAGLAPLALRGRQEVRAEGVAETDILVEKFLDMRYAGQSFELTVPWLLDGQKVQADFHRLHQHTYGYAHPGAPLEIVNLRARATGKGQAPLLPPALVEDEDPSPALIGFRPVTLSQQQGQIHEPASLPFYSYELLRPGNIIQGPAIVVRADTTILIGPGDQARVDAYSNLIINIPTKEAGIPPTEDQAIADDFAPRPAGSLPSTGTSGLSLTAPTYSPVRLEIFKHLLASIAEEMGVVLKKASYSPNIKERRDYSCAVFDRQGNMIAQAAHIPVHLGSMPLSVAAAVQAFSKQAGGLQEGDLIILNDPFRGGTHLPDITLVSPVFLQAGVEANDPSGVPDLEGITNPHLFGFVACRAHHADVGGISAGSMPVAREIYQEGLIIPPLKLFEGGRLNQAVIDLILANVRTPQERQGDLWAQIAANQRGATRLRDMTLKYGPGEVSFYMNKLLAYTERMTRRLLSELPDGEYGFTDYLDDDGISPEPVKINVKVGIQGDQACVDFSGSDPQCKGSVNAVYAITLSAVYYVFRCLLGLDVPNNSGCLRPVDVIAPTGTVVNALSPAAVAAGNVETSQRIVDVLLGALAQACPERIPAASQGTMNNLTIGGLDTRQPGAPKPYTYYETVGGGMGARPTGSGPSALHSHMTNTLNTPVEALEYAYPLRVLRYEIRAGSGGRGKHRGGDGICRDIQVLGEASEAQATLITDRRQGRPYGLAGGSAGQTGQNLLLRDGKEEPLPGKGSVYLKGGDILSLRTPGGGGFGQEETPEKGNWTIPNLES